jgi:hypothetical protein
MLLFRSPSFSTGWPLFPPSSLYTSHFLNTPSVNSLLVLPIRLAPFSALEPLCHPTTTSTRHQAGSLFRPRASMPSHSLNTPSAPFRSSSFFFLSSGRLFFPPSVGPQCCNRCHHVADLAHFFSFLSPLGPYIPLVRHPAAAAEDARARAILRPIRKRRSFRADSNVALSESNSASMAAFPQPVARSCCGPS